MNEELCRRVLEKVGLHIDDDDRITCTEEDSPGMSYSSLLQRFTVSLTEPHDCQPVQLIVKSNPDKRHLPDSLFDKMFSCEIKVYKNILPLFEKLFERTGNQIIWPELYLITEQQQIIMQDLKPRFRTNLEGKGSSLDEACLAVNSLAMFHAASLAAKAEGKLDGDSLEPYFYCRNDRTNNAFFKDGLRILAKTMRHSWDRAWLNTAEKLEAMSVAIGDYLLKCHDETDDKFKVINHGDYWRANLMFHYDENNSPVSFRFVDFQLSHYGSFAWDLCYFFYVNPNTSLRYEYFDKLIVSYHDTMELFLDRCGRKSASLSLPEIRLEVERLSLYGFLKSCTDLPYQICPVKAGVDAENLFQYNEETEKLKSVMYSAENYKTVVENHLKQIGPILNSWTLSG